MERRLTVQYSKPIFVELQEAIVVQATGVNKLWGNTVTWPVRDLGPNGCRVNRQFSDFLWLRNQLKESHMFIPGLPPKTGLFSRIHQEPETIAEELRFKLERFLNRIYERGFLRTHPATKAFMTAQNLTKEKAFKDYEAESKNVGDRRKVINLREAFPGIDEAEFPEDIGNNSEDAVVRLQEIFREYKKSLFDILFQMQKFIISLHARSAMDGNLADIVSDNLETERSNEGTMRSTIAKVGIVKNIREWASYYERIGKSVERQLLHPLGYEYEDANSWIQLCDYCRRVRLRFQTANKRVETLTASKKAAEEKGQDSPPAKKSRNPFSRLTSGPKWGETQETELEIALIRQNELEKLTELTEKVVLVYERPKHWNGKNRSFNLTWGDFKSEHAEMCSKLNNIIKSSQDPGGIEDSKLSLWE